MLLAPFISLATADISLNTGYLYNSNNNLPETYYLQQQQQIQYPAQNVIPNSFLDSNTQFLAQQHQPITQLQNQQKYVTAQMSQFGGLQFPMPADFPSTFNFPPNINTKPTLRYRPRTRIPKKPIITKHFFIHSAPEETQAEIDGELNELQQQPSKHYNVLFVKTPTQTSKAAALSLAKSLKEEKTVVYVLSKKTSAAELQEAIQETPQHINKPEVFFIKYRTPEEAAHAQRQIQAQYDNLGGATSISDEGTAPLTSVVGSLDGPQEDEEEEQQLPQQLLENSLIQHEEQQQPQSASNNDYLPPASSKSY